MLKKSDDMSGKTGLFAAVSRMDERLAKYGQPLNKQLLIPLNIFDKVHTVMMSEQGIISGEDASKILKVLKKVDELGVDKFPWAKGDLWAQKERFVIGEIGEDVGGRLHTGRSRQDVTCTIDRLHLRPKVIEMAEKLSDFREALLNLAEKHTETVMPCYTFLQHAQPTTFAHYLLSFAYAFARDFNRIIRAYELTNLSPAGSALQTGTSYPLNRHRVSELLGFGNVIRNTRDAAMNFDYLYEIMTAASLSMTDLLRLQEDFTVWHSVEFKMISLDDPWVGTSSIMPQKRNPYPFMFTRGKALRIFGRTIEAFSTLESPTLGFPTPKYLANDLYEVIDEFLGAFIIAAGYLPTLRVNKDLMCERAGAYWAQGTDLADVIVREKGISFRTAHHIIAELVKIANEAGKGPSDVNSELMDEAAKAVIGKPLGLSENAIKGALDPTLCVKIRRVYGATAPEEVMAQIEECRTQLSADRAKVEESRKQIDDAMKKLDKVVDGMISK